MRSCFVVLSRRALSSRTFLCTLLALALDACVWSNQRARPFIYLSLFLSLSFFSFSYSLPLFFFFQRNLNTIEKSFCGWLPSNSSLIRMVHISWKMITPTKILFRISILVYGSSYKRIFSQVTFILLFIFLFAF